MERLKKVKEVADKMLETKKDREIDFAQILRELPRSYLFDPKIITKNSRIDLSNYTQSKTLSEDEDFVTLELTQPNGHSIQRSIYKNEEYVHSEGWNDEEGRTIIKYYSPWIRSERISDKHNKYEMIHYPDGKFNLSRTHSNGLFESYIYDKEGNPIGVQVYREKVDES